MTLSLGQFKQLLAGVHRDVNRDAILLSNLGAALRRQEPQFEPRTYGFEKLIELLRQVPDVGSIVVNEAPGAERFVFAGTASPDGGDQGVLLRSDIWRALMDFRPHTDPCHLDLSDFSLRRVSEDDKGLLTSEPERFITLPTIDPELQKSLARRLVAEQRPELVSILEERLTEQRWYSAMTELFRDSALDESWSKLRVKEVVKVVLSWAAQHGIAAEKITFHPPRRVPATPSSTGSSAPTARRDAPVHHADAPSTDELRALIHDAIDLMSTPELAALAIPPAYLMMATLRRMRQGTR